jgi:retinol dehydrogenase-12
MDGRLYLVTGANTGIGRVTARELARRGGTVILACRSLERAAPVVDAIRRQTGNDAVDVLELDLASFASVRRAAQTFLSSGRPLNVLVNNAGLAAQRGITADGFELAFGTNHLGHFLLTNLLLDRIRESATPAAPARVVTVTSKAHFGATGIDFEAVRRRTRSISGYPEYQVSKLANLLFSIELHRRLEGQSVSTYAVHPGVVASDIWRRIPRLFRWYVTRNMIDEEEGAKTTLFCATDPDVADRSGLYWDRSEPRTPSGLATDDALAAELWRKSAEWTGLDETGEPEPA